MKKIFVLITLSVMATSIYAQVNKNVQVSRNYNPSVTNAQKITFDPNIAPESVSGSEKFNYSISPKSSSGNLGLSQISTARIISDDSDNLVIGYLKAGISYKFLPMLDFYINNKNTKDALVGFYANHRSFWGKTELKNQGCTADVKSDFMNNNVGAFAKLFLNSTTVTFNADYTRKYLRLYGIDPRIKCMFPALYNEKNKRNFNMFDINANLKSNNDDGEVFYAAGISYDFFGGNNKFDDRSKYKENTFGLSGLLGAQIIDEKHSVFAKFKADFYNRNDVFGREDQNIIISVIPTWTFNNESVEVNLGFQYLMDKNRKKTKPRLYPAISLTYKLYDFFVPMLEVKGETEVNSFSKISVENEYINFEALNRIGLKNTNNKIIAIFSIKGYVDALSYNVFASYTKINHLPLFQNVQYLNFDFNTFNIMYSNGHKTSLGAEISYNDDLFALYAKAVYNNYNVKMGGEKLEHAWHKPNFESTLTVKYKVADNMNLTCDLHAMSNRYAFDTNTEKDIKLKNVFDLGFGAEVMITNKFSTFVGVSNLLNKKYDIYSRYKVPGIMLSGGITLKF